MTYAIPVNSQTAKRFSSQHRREHAATDGMIYAPHQCRAIAAQLTLAAELIEAQEQRRLAGLSFSPYAARREVLLASEDFDKLKLLMEARS